MVNELIDGDPLSISWEITPAEQGMRNSRTLKLIVKLLPILLLPFLLNFPLWIDFVSLCIAIFLFNKYLAFLYIVISALCVIAAIIIIKYFFLKYSPRRVYFLDMKGITISKDGRKKFYPWNDFECYYPYTVIRHVYEGNRDLYKIQQEEQEISGQIFYLKKKRINLLGRICKTFVVVKSEPDNSELVDTFLAIHLLKKEMTATTDAGIVFFEFD